MCPLLRARTGAAAIPLAVPAAIFAAAGLLVRSLQKASSPQSVYAIEEPDPEPDIRTFGTPTQLQTLVYELLDAHADTIRLAGDLEEEDRVWAAHTDYLRALQREGRALLSVVALDQAA
jgi:hypothetical protein